MHESVTWTLHAGSVQERFLGYARFSVHSFAIHSPNLRIAPEIPTQSLCHPVTKEELQELTNDVYDSFEQSGNGISVHVGHMREAVPVLPKARRGIRYTDTN